MGFDYDLFVIGGGSGGVRCARVAAGHGARVAVAEERHWGGTCVNIGCVPKKIMVQAAECGAAIADAAAFGWSRQPPTHDWAALKRARDREIARLEGIYASLLAGADVAAFKERAVFVGPHELDVGGRRVTAERIVIAVGGVPQVRPAIPGMNLGIVSDGVFALERLPAHVAIVGGGYIGVEFAHVFSGLGARVEMVFRQHLPLRGFEPELRHGLAAAMAAEGVRLHASAVVDRVELAGARRRLVLGGGHAIETDLVLFALGRTPNVEGLGLEKAGVALTSDGRIAADGECATDAPHVFAIGDVSNRQNLTPVAIAQGHRLADRLFGPGAPREWNLAAVPTAVFSSPPMATCGLGEAQAAARGPAKVYLTEFTPLRHAITKRPGRKCLLKLIVDAASDVVLGAHMLGEDAPEIMQGLGIAITGGLRKADFDRTVGIHPTAAEEWVTLRTLTRVARAEGD